MAYGAAAGLVAGLVVGEGIAKDVRLSVDGNETALNTFSGTVRDLLAREGVKVGPHDLVSPPVDSPLANGSEVVVRHARPLRLTVDGRSTTRMVTALNVGEALEQLDLKAARMDQPVSRLRVLPRAGFALRMRTVRRVTVLVGDVRTEATTTAGTVREVLKAERVKLGKGYKVKPGLHAFPAEGAVIRVIKPPPPKPPAPPRTALRTGAAPSSVAALNWAGLARCESGGRAKAVNRSGPYYGLYQFSLPTWRSVGGTKTPIDWSEEEQTYRAQLLYQKVGGRWQSQWPHCGRFLFTR
ncbi:resuscitation-promoting factor [Bailinhaonella thermotolerans]|uniref:resuscitation-promoting factor n=1 Tax=Bailinhaonella thermotolerans TaxID=1070861 RepID=UPI0011C459FC|nr:resuscitation-promoting factor [Bailinhaonella thermotolerans]